MSEQQGRGDLTSAADRDWVELAATILMSIAAILTAWAGFQSAKWSGVQANNFSVAGANRIESSQESLLANEQRSLDITVFLTWLRQAQLDVDVGVIPNPRDVGRYEPTDGSLSGFLYVRLPPRFLPAVEAWLATDPFVDEDSPASPLQMSEYQNPARAKAHEFKAAAESAAEVARTANQNSDNYVTTTIVSALVLFFAALGSKLKYRRNQLVALSIGVVLILATVGAVLTLPIEV